MNESARGRVSEHDGPGACSSAGTPLAPSTPFFADMRSDPPRRLLFLRPDTYGDLVLFEPVLRMVRHVWPDTEVGVLIRQPYQDVISLISPEGVHWLTTTCDPYRKSPGESRAALDDLREVVRTFAPDCLVAACTTQTWLESAVAAFLPGTRQVSLGQGLVDPVLRAALDEVLPLEWAAIYPEKIPVDSELAEWERNLLLAGALLGDDVPRWQPAAHVPEEAQAQAAQILAETGLVAGEFVVCAAGGTANVQIKSWPLDRYGETLVFLERERGVRALLVGHSSEREHLETIRRVARLGGAEPALWTGTDGEMPVLAGLLQSSRFYFGNDTGALHLAAALGRPVVPIFGGGHWPRFKPVASHSLTVVQPLPCFGCAWECYFVDAPCVRTISPASVQLALASFLDDGLEGQRVVEAEGLEAGTRALIQNATPQLRFLRVDRAARGKQITELTTWLRESEADRAALRKRLEAADGQTRFEEDEDEDALFPGMMIEPATQTTPHFEGTETRWSHHDAPAQRTAVQTKDPEAPPAAGLVDAADLSQRLQGSRTQELAARGEARRLAQELVLARRLLRFQFTDQPGDSTRPQPALVTEAMPKFARLLSVLKPEDTVFHIDSCQHQDGTLVVTGWAFCRARGWDAAATTVTLIFRHGAALHHAATRRVLRPDVAGHFAGHGAELAGGARDLEGGGFSGEIPLASLTTNPGWEIGLHLECAGMTRERFTGARLWV